jgi:pimeloyl-ACP methyl ester carboxylesterase
MALELASDSVGSGAPLLILHGLFGSRRNWRSIARGLSDGHRVISVDLRNHGESPWSDAMSYPEMAADVRDLMKREELDRPAVMGHSMGGKTAMALALLHPDEVGQLIVVDIAPISYADRLSVFARGMQSVDLGTASGRDDVARRLSSLVPEPGVVPFLLQNLVMHDGQFDWRINLAAISGSMGALSGFPPELASRRFEGPVHVIAGGRSDYVTRRLGEDFRPMFPQAEVEVVEQAGHWVHADQQAAFLECMKRALRAGSPPHPARAAS